MSADVGSDLGEKSHKKSKRKHRPESDEMDIDSLPDASELPKRSKKEKKDKKSKEKKRKDRAEEVDADVDEHEIAPTPEKKHKRLKSEDKPDKKDKSHKKHQRRSPSPHDIPAEPRSVSRQSIVPEDKQYPFFTQTFSQRIPIWPAAFDEPLTKITHEYLDPMLNRYSPQFKGVLLAYKNVNLSDRPRRANPHNPPTDETPVVLESFECYAPPFAWLTADLHLFVPSRGVWMEGEINLQSEGHIGVVCFDKFNASISRRSLPRGWKWEEHEEEEDDVPAVDDEVNPFGEEGQNGAAEDGDGGNGDAEAEAQEGEKSTKIAPRLRSTGYWLDENGKKVEGKIFFRIKNFSSGSTGDYTYLSLQGTMLDDEAEKESAAEERQMEKARRARQNPSGLLYPTMRLPEFSMTKLKDSSI